MQSCITVNYNDIDLMSVLMWKLKISGRIIMFHLFVITIYLLHEYLEIAKLTSRWVLPLHTAEHKSNRVTNSKEGLASSTDISRTFWAVSLLWSKHETTTTFLRQRNSQCSGVLLENRDRRMPRWVDQRTR